VLEDITRRAKSLKPLRAVTTALEQTFGIVPGVRNKAAALILGLKWVYFRQTRAGSGGKSLKVSDR
jgi:hypothetical protein